MTQDHESHKSQPGRNRIAKPHRWADAPDRHQYDIADHYLSMFPEIAEMVPPTAEFTVTATQDGSFYGYVAGGLPNDDSWFTYPWTFLGNASVPADFFAAGYCEGPQGNSFWLTVAIRKQQRAFWLRAFLGNLFGADYMAEATELCKTAAERWRAGDGVVVTGVHVEKLPTPLPFPLFTDRIIDGRPETWPEPTE
jgi:hypothetical protein